MLSIDDKALGNGLHSALGRKINTFTLKNVIGRSIKMET
jgi:hypothetical protein